VVAIALFGWFAGLVMITLFTFNAGRVATRFADWQVAQRQRHPRYYAILDPFGLAQSVVWHRLWGAVVGAIFLISGTVALFSKPA
jgi:hypothetical protein